MDGVKSHAQRGPGGARPALARTLLPLALAGALPGCASPPKELARLRVENELLREELRIVRQNCSFYRDLDVELEEPTAPGSP